VTLLSLGDVLQEQFKQLDLLITIYDDGIVAARDVIQPTVKSSLLLDVIFLLLLEINDVGQSYKLLVRHTLECGCCTTEKSLMYELTKKQSIAKQGYYVLAGNNIERCEVLPQIIAKQHHLRHIYFSNWNQL
jgi:hypothetical protein